MKHKCDGCRHKGEHQEMMFRPFGVCTKETNLIEAEKAYNAEKCPYKKTNADRIRGMSDDELIKLLIEFSAFSCIFPDKDCEEISCVECVTNWLKQPAEDE